jgi:hypothetical protein
VYGSFDRAVLDLHRVTSTPDVVVTRALNPNSRYTFTARDLIQSKNASIDLEFVFDSGKSLTDMVNIFAHPLHHSIASGRELFVIF